MRLGLILAALALPLALMAQPAPGPGPGPVPAITALTGDVTTPAGGGSVPATVNTITHAAPYVTAFSGIDCTGVSDSSTGFQTALNAGASVLRIPANCTIIVNSDAFPAAGIAIIGDDPLTSVIKHKASATGHMLYQNNSGAWTITLENLTIDGNYQNATGVTYAAVRFYNASTSATNPAIAFVKNVHFINGEYDDIDSSYSSVPNYLYYTEQGTWHLGGADNGHAEQWGGGMRATLSNIIVDHQRLPTSITDVGRAGIIFYSGPTDAIDNQIDATNIQCNDTGISAAASLGCLDAYHGAIAYTLTNSQSYNAIGRGFTWKADSQNVAVTNNIVTNLAGNPTNPSGNSVNTAFGANSGTLSTVGTDWTLNGNQCFNSGNDCYVVTAHNTDTTQWASKIVMANNIADGCGSGRRGISVTTGINLRIGGGLITGCDVPIYFATDAGVTGTFTNGQSAITGTGLPSATGQAVVLTTTGALPTNFATNTVYYVLAGSTSSSITLGATAGGSAIVAGSAGSGTQTVTVSGGPVRVTDVMIRGTGKATINAGTKAASLWWARNQVDSGAAWSASDLKLTVNSNAIQAWNPVAIIDTSGSAQTLSTINGVPDGELITVKASSASNALTISSGGNIVLRGTAYIADTASSITFAAINGNLVEIGRASPSLNGFLTVTNFALASQVADATTAGGNARGLNAVDLQTCTRSAATQVASATNAVALGCDNTASGNTAIVLGNNSTASGANSVTLGTRATDQGRLGYFARAAGRIGANGDAQDGLAILRASTASTSVVTLTSDGNAAGATNIVNLVANSAMGLALTFIGRDTTTGDVCYWTANAVVRRASTAGSTALYGSPTFTAVNTCAGTLASQTAPTIAVDTTNAGVTLAVTPISSNATHWVATAKVTEIQ